MCFLYRTGLLPLRPPPGLSGHESYGILTLFVVPIPLAILIFFFIVERIKMFIRAVLLYINCFHLTCLYRGIIFLYTLRLQRLTAIAIPLLQDVEKKT